MDGAVSVMYEMMSGMLLFGGVFMLGDPATSPARSWCKIAYAVTAACAVMFFRHFGRFEESFVFVILVMNGAVWGFDMLGELAASKIRRWKKE
jgi:Na+-translocating ferredoxin:NAD+ oxidoreductase RnfD subunit